MCVGIEGLVAWEEEEEESNLINLKR